MLVQVDDLGCQVDSEITSLLDEFGFAGAIENPLQKGQFIGFECLKETNMIFKHRWLTAPLPSTEIITAPYPTFCSAWKRPPAYRSREVFSPGEHRQQLLLSAYACSNKLIMSAAIFEAASESLAMERLRRISSSTRSSTTRS